MSNLNELDVPEDVDEATDFAIRREFGMRFDSYREATLWGVVERAQGTVVPFTGAYELSDPKHPEFHSIHVDLWDAREGK